MTAATRSTAERAWVALLDGVQYAVALNAALVALLGVPVAVLTGSLVGLKWLLFLAGLLMIGAGAWQLRPAPPGEGTDGGQIGRGDPGGGGFGGRVGHLPPVAWYAPEPDERLSGGGRLLFAGALAWVVSFALERALGVGVPVA